MIKLPSMVVCLQRTRVNLVKDSGAHMLFRFLQSLESDSSALRRAYVDKLRDLYKLFSSAADIEPGVTAAIEILEAAEKVAVYPEWATCGSMVKLALIQCDTSIRFAMQKEGVNDFAVDDRNCSDELRNMFEVASAARVAECEIQSQLNEQSAAHGQQSFIPIASFTSKLKTDGSVDKRWAAAEKSFKKVQQKANVMLDSQIEGCANDIVKSILPDANGSK